jgi:hypothetical protein
MKPIGWRRVLLALLIACPLLAQVRISGFPPSGISSASLLYDYKHIHSILAPQQRIDLSPLNVDYFFRRDLPAKADALPEWGGGGAIGKDTIIVPLDAQPFLNQDFAQITLHELTHIALNRICPAVRLPRWFHEGMAMMLSGEANSQEQFILSRAILVHNLMPLGAIDSINLYGKFRAEVAYSQSRQAVRYMVDTWGIESVQNILQKTNRCGDFWCAVDQELAISAQEFEQLYLAGLNKRFEALVFLSDTYLVWIVIVLLFLLAYIVTRFRNAAKARAMAEAEEADNENGVDGTTPPSTPGSP